MIVAVASFAKSTDSGFAVTQLRLSPSIDIKIVSVPSPIFLTSTLKTADEPGIFSIDVTSALISTPLDSSTLTVKVKESCDLVPFAQSSQLETPETLTE